ncbi:MAG: sterol desaturase family protein [Actinomycetota bacterium]
MSRSNEEPSTPTGWRNPSRRFDRSEPIRRGLLVYVGLGTLVVAAALLLSGSDQLLGRTLLVDDGSYTGVYAAVGALETEELGLSTYDWALLIGGFFVTLEFLRLYLGRDRDRDRRLWVKDSLASLSTLIPLFFVEAIAGAIMVIAYFWVWDNLALVQLPVNAWTIVIGVVAADLAYYWEHRTAHEVRLLWTGHAVHHSSPILNTAVAFRFGPLEPFVAIVFHLPLVVLGLHPAVVIAGELIVQAYQFWIHTDTIGSMGRLDRILNTPSNHRVHHGSDPEYLDRNHGGILMVWDRMFGTYQRELQTPTYGLTEQIDTTNPLRVWISEWPRMFHDIRHAASWRDRLHHTFDRPGWSPADRTPAAAAAGGSTDPTRLSPRPPPPPTPPDGAWPSPG